MFVAPFQIMDKYNDMFDEDPGLEGPDYVALIIDWDATADSIEDELSETTQPIRTRQMWRTASMVAGVAGALGVLALAGWGVKRLMA